MEGGEGELIKTFHTEGEGEVVGRGNRLIDKSIKFSDRTVIMSSPASYRNTNTQLIIRERGGLWWILILFLICWSAGGEAAGEDIT